MRCDDVESIVLEPQEVLALFQHFTGVEEILDPVLYRLESRLEKAVAASATIEEMELLRKSAGQGFTTRE